MGRHALVTAPRLPAHAWRQLAGRADLRRDSACAWRPGISAVIQIVDALVDGRCVRCLTATEVHFVGAALHCGSQLPLWTCEHCDRRLEHRVRNGPADSCWGWCTAGSSSATWLVGVIETGFQHADWRMCQRCDLVLRSAIVTAAHERDAADATAARVLSGSCVRPGPARTPTIPCSSPEGPDDHVPYTISGRHRAPSPSWARR